MRGALDTILKQTDDKRIIPADAGSTESERILQYPQKDHPRGCGEHWVIFPFLPEVKGSSPRMRGAPYRPGRGSSRARIIPADAGSTHGELVPGVCSPDHPRGCGEHPVTKPEPLTE